MFLILFSTDRAVFWGENRELNRVLEAETINYSRSSSRGCENGGKVARMRRRRGKGRLDFQDGPVQRMVEKGENPGFCTGGLENAPLKRQNFVDNLFVPSLIKKEAEIFIKIARTCDFG